ncbi:MAG: porin family protein [Bacteroidia bacterium]
MKKIALLLLMMNSYTFANAQQGLHIGAEGAGKLRFIMNQNTYGDPEYEYAPTVGYTAGFVLGYNFVDFFGFQIEANYSLQGQSYEEVKDNLSVTRDVELRYFEFPVMLKYTAPEASTRFFAMGGVQFSSLHKARIDYFSGSEDRSTPNAKPRFENTDVALVLGTGVDFDLFLNLYATIGLRFTYGFVDINDGEWRIPNLSGNYNSSRNGSAGVKAGIHYQF